jgi:hypothetical protein
MRKFSPVKPRFAKERQQALRIEALKEEKQCLLRIIELIKTVTRATLGALQCPSP